MKNCAICFEILYMWWKCNLQKTFVSDSILYIIVAIKKRLTKRFKQHELYFRLINFVIRYYCQSTIVRIVELWFDRAERIVAKLIRIVCFEYYFRRYVITPSRKIGCRIMRNYRWKSLDRSAHLKHCAI